MMLFYMCYSNIIIYLYIKINTLNALDALLSSSACDIFFEYFVILYVRLGLSHLVPMKAYFLTLICREVHTLLSWFPHLDICIFCSLSLFMKPFNYNIYIYIYIIEYIYQYNCIILNVYNYL